MTLLFQVIDRFEEFEVLWDGVFGGIFFLRREKGECRMGWDGRLFWGLGWVVSSPGDLFESPILADAGTLVDLESTDEHES